MPEEALSFEHKFIEAEMKSLAQEIARHREAPEVKSLSEEELLKKAIQSAPPSAVAAIITNNDDKQKKQNPLPAYIQDAPPEVRLEVEYLLDMAYHHGTARAVREAKKSPYFVQDALHDALVKFFYPKMKEQGILK